MTNAQPLIRPESTALVVIDEQEKLMPVIEGAEGIITNTQRLLRLAKWLNVPALLTTQNRKGLGAIVPGVQELAGAEPLDKVSFGCMGDDGFRAKLAATAPPGGTLLLAGVEAHVCVMQTALGALAEGYRVHVIADAVGSRKAANREIGLERMRGAGAVISSTEMAIFELLGDSKRPEFKQILAFLK